MEEVKFANSITKEVYEKMEELRIKFDVKDEIYLNSTDKDNFDLEEVQKLIAENDIAYDHEYMITRMDVKEDGMVDFYGVKSDKAKQYYE